MTQDMLKQALTLAANSVVTSFGSKDIPGIDETISSYINEKADDIAANGFFSGDGSEVSVIALEDMTQADLQKLSDDIQTEIAEMCRNLWFKALTRSEAYSICNALNPKSVMLAAFCGPHMTVIGKTYDANNFAVAWNSTHGDETPINV